MILLEGFLVRLMIGITKNPSRRIINVTFLIKRTRLYTADSGYEPGFSIIDTLSLKLEKTILMIDM